MIHLDATAWASLIMAGCAVAGLAIGVVKETNSREQRELERAERNLRAAERRGYWKRQNEIKDRVLGQIDTALALLPNSQGEIRRLLIGVQKVLTATTEREGTEDVDS